VSKPLEERVLVLAPSTLDPELSQALTHSGIAWEASPDAAHLCGALAEGAAAVLLTAEPTTAPKLDLFLTWLERQPTWSELPVLLLAAGDSLSDPLLLERLGNVTLLERPLRLLAFTTAVQTALRSRRHQYQIREHLREREAAEQALRESEERLRFSLEAGHLGFWQHDLAADQLFASNRCKAHFGRAPHEPFTHHEVLSTVHPEDRERTQQAILKAIRHQEGYVLEYRVLWPDGSVHWLMVRGRANYAATGRPTSTFGVTLDITQRKDAEALQAEQSEQLRRLTESLREAARRKDEFLAMLAHELRNPLSPVANAVEIMRARPSRAQGERARGVVERQLRHMSRLIDDLLDVSRINTGKITLKRECLDLVAAIERALETAHGFIAQSEHQLEAHFPAAPVYVHADPVRVEQVITNLLHNAAKYTEAGGTIWVVLETADASARLRIRDTGIGIPPTLLGQVFDLFTQGERGLDRAQGGLGLGLTLVRNLTLLHGGSVEAFSAGIGQGSEFVVTLPLLSATAEEPTALPATPPPASFSPQPSPKVLVVDDNRDAAETLAELVELWGFEVETAHDGLSALQHASEWEPNVVFLDIGMPGLNGYEVARRLRADARFRDVTLVALTGYGQQEDFERSRAAGFDHHLVKPVDVSELEKLLPRRPSTDPE
jgi:two-component system CheB/CheR fusion protein